VDKIRVLNPRSRNKKKFDEIVGSISDVGLKKPITVSRRPENKDDDGYDLCCGQGRLEAYINLGQTEVPAIVVNVTREERLIMSLVENIARRNPTSLEHVKMIAELRERGYTAGQISKKIGMAKTPVVNLLHLLDHGESRLIKEVEWERIPLNVAVMIASANDEEIQKALTEAYEKKQLKSKDVLRVRKIMEKRKIYGKTYGVIKPGSRKTPSSEDVIRAYNQEAQKQRHLVKKAKLCETRLLFVTNALHVLFKDENFVNLLRAENIDSLPQYLAENIGR
jgi:ParB family transcriptional regulator, chromosome partitioning protein